MRRRLRAALLATALAVVALAAGPPLVNAITATLFVIGTLEPVKANNDGIKLKTKAPTAVHVRKPCSTPATSSTGTTIRGSR